MDELTCCPHCGSDEGYYTKDYVSGSCRTYLNFDGSEGENSGIYSNLIHRQGNTTYCRSCHKKLGRMDQ